MTTLIQIPQRFYFDHQDRDLPTPAIVRSTTKHLFIAADAPELDELLSDAEHYANDGIDADSPELRGLVISAKATAKAIRSARDNAEAEQPEAPDSAPTGATEAQGEEPAADAPAKADTAPQPRTVRAGTKNAKLVELLSQKDGASADEIAKETGWQNHTIRAAITTIVKKKLGLTVTTEKVEGRGTVYRVAA